MLLLPASTHADGPADNQTDRVRRIPPPGLAVPDEARRELAEGAARLAQEIATLRGELAAKPALLARLPDVQVLHKAVDWALRYDEFFKTNEVDAARAQLREGHARAAALRDGRTPWLTRTGPLVLGYESRIDGSVQPYGLVVPDSYAPNLPHRYRLDFWFHGRGEQLSELAFVHDRTRNRGEFTPRDAFVLHPYGRYCNGSRFAGETDAWEALEDVQRLFPIDDDRLVVRGFSLGGAACWHFAVHHAWRWAAAAPGAGFSETAEFLRVFQNEELRPPWWEQKLWRLHDATAHALNTAMVPLVAYSGEKDRQIQAAQAMEKAMAAEGVTLSHILGGGAGHQYTPDAKAEINRRIDAAAVQGRDPLPRTVQFVTHSLRYNRMAWVVLDGLERHWEPARVEARLAPEGQRIEVTTVNVAALTLTMDPGRSPFDPRRPVIVELDGARLNAPPPASDRSWEATFQRLGGTWQPGTVPFDQLRKRPGLQGPIDDAFTDSFLFVRPTGPPMNEAVGRWTAAEMTRAIEHWRRHFRGEVRIKADTEITRDDMTLHHLVLWGDPLSNRVLAQFAERWPVKWSQDGVEVGGQRFDGGTHVPLLVYPNLVAGWRRYVVVNSGFTFRDYDYLNNARQTPKLPDWAVVDLSRPADARAPGRIAAAGFFGERWEWIEAR